VHVDDDLQDHPESLLDHAIRGDLSACDQAELDRHLAECAGCAAELEVALAFRAAIAPGAHDDALNQSAVEMALMRVQDEALNQSAVEKAMDRLEEREPFRERLRRLLGFQGWPRPIGLAALGAAVVVLAIGFTLRQTRPPEPPVAARAKSSLSLMLDDGSEVAPVDGATAIQLAEQIPSRTTVRLRSGGALFRIRHDSQRLFRVDAGPFVIEDLGTVFRVDHQTEGKIRVVVSEGRVAVLHAASRLRVELGAGDDRVFSPAPDAEAVEPAREARQPVPETVVETSQASPLAASATGARAQSDSRMADAPADLLLSADLARRSGHPQAAVAPLRRLVKRYPKDPRAAAAAFTLGWLLLTDLGRSREAAVTFAEAERIAPRGALAEDAAARVAEAWQKAGDSRRAAEAARRYQQVYPTGRYTGLMRGLVGEN
jgi:transmembrane sensor